MFVRVFIELHLLYFIKYKGQSRAEPTTVLKLTCSTICRVSSDHTTFPEVHLSCTRSSETTPYASRAACLPLINIPQTVVETVFFPESCCVCVCVSLSDRSPPTTVKVVLLWRGLFSFSCYTTGGHCSVCLHTLRSLWANICRKLTVRVNFIWILGECYDFWTLQLHGKYNKILFFLELFSNFSVYSF